MAKKLKPPAFTDDGKNVYFGLFDQYMQAKRIPEVLAFYSLMGKFELWEDYYASRKTSHEAIIEKIGSIFEECDNK